MDTMKSVIRLSFLLFVVRCCCAKYFIAAPNLLRVGVEETVSVSVSEINKEVTVKLYLQDYPHRKKTFSQVEGKFTSLLPGELKVKVSPNDLPDKKSGDKQYVYLVASSSTPGFQFNNEIKILISFQNAMVFVQTDKPIYNPGQTVSLRVIPLDLNLKASLKNVTIEILNPQGILVQRWKNHNTDDGFFSLTKDLSENALLGNWTVVALYGHELVQNASVHFEVREYVLPKFSVKVSGPDYISEGDKIIAVQVTSKYTYGKSVKGTAQINLAVLDDAGKTERFSTSLHQLNKGSASVIVNTDILRNHKKNLWFPDGKRLLIEAKVIEDVTGQQEKVLDNTIYFTKSPIKISFKRSPKFFKPGMPFEIKVDVAYVNGAPAKGIEISLDAKTDSGVALHERPKPGQPRSKANKDMTDPLGRGSFVVDLPKDFTIKHLVLKVTAKVNRGGHDLSSESSFQPTVYKSPGNNFIFVRVPKSKVGDWTNAEAFVMTKGNPTSLSYLVIARGKVAAQGKISRNIGVVFTIRFKVTPEMSPEARFVAYYIIGSEVVVDSAVMEVEERFPNQVEFEGDQNPKRGPTEGYSIKIKTSPYSRVGILAVDKSVYLLRNDKHLTSKKVFQTLKSHDLGCGAGGGLDSKDVLSRAGLAVMTNFNNLKTNPRTEERCPVTSRRKRRSIYLPHQTKCCRLGEVRDSSSCLVRGQQFAKNVSASLFPKESCVIRFYICCKKKFEKVSRLRSSNDIPIPNNLLDGAGFDFDEQMLRATLEEMQIRTDFPETWIHEDARTGKDGRVVVPVTVPGSITTWIIQAISVSNTTGFGLASPLHLTAFRNFFVSLSMPYSAQRGEQVSIVATVYNYVARPQVVRLYLQSSPDNEFCSYIEPGLYNTMYQVKVEPESATSVSFPIVPTVVKEIPVQVIAVSSGFSGDAEQRKLKVVPEGMQRRQTHSVMLDPQDVLRDPSAPKPTKPAKPAKPAKASRISSSTKENGVQRNRVNLTLPESTVPESESARLFVIGNLIGPAVSDVIEGRGLDSIIQLPQGCGEQTMLTLAPNVFVLQYLRSTKQVTPQIETKAFNFIRSGYQRELNYRRSDHSFSAFGESRPGSTWLTAFVIKTFCAIQKLGGIDVDQNVICSAIKWLSSIQRADGAIPEKNPVIHQEMNGDINGEIAMTAYVVTALMECTCRTQNTYRTMRSAVSFLENNRARIGRVYVKAVVAYALALASSPRRIAANNDLLLAAHHDANKNVRYWTDGGNAIDVETTAYALLTQMVLKRTKYSGPIIVWLTEQRKGGGGFVSTQDTCVALQALTAYSKAAAGNVLDLKVVVTSDLNGNYRRSFSINKLNALEQQQLDISDLIGGELYVETKGTGVAQLQVETIYNTPASEKESCQFDLSVTTVEQVKRVAEKPIIINRRKKRSKPGRRKGGKRRKSKRRRRKGKRKRRKGRRRRTKPKTTRAPLIQRDQPTPNSISFKICTRYKKAGQSAGMSIIDVGILTGFSADRRSLTELQKNGKLGIAKFEMSDRHVILYLDNVPSSREICINLEMKRDFEVGLVQPVPVTVYDYYEPDNKCTKYYGPKASSKLRFATCDKDDCRCTLDKCTSCSPSDDVPTVIREICNDYNFAFRGKARTVDEQGNWLHIKIDVKDVMKFGKHKLLKGDRITFVKRSSCKCPRIGGDTLDTDYLIMGKDDNFHGGRVTLDSNVFVKNWVEKGPGARFYRLFQNALNKPNPCS